MNINKQRARSHGKMQITYSILRYFNFFFPFANNNPNLIKTLREKINEYRVRIDTAVYDNGNTRYVFRIETVVEWFLIPFGRIRNLRSRESRRRTRWTR